MWHRAASRAVGQSSCSAACTCAASPCRSSPRRASRPGACSTWASCSVAGPSDSRPRRAGGRSEEHTSELQSQSNLVCRLLLEKKKKKKQKNKTYHNTHKRSNGLLESH